MGQGRNPRPCAAPLADQAAGLKKPVLTRSYFLALIALASFKIAP